MLFIFDMGGVVTNTAKSEGLIARELGVTVDELREAQKPDLFSLLTCGKIDEKDFWRRVGKNLGIKIETPWWEYFFHPKMNEEVRELILRLRDLKGADGRRNRVVCGTNTIWAHYYNHLARGDYEIFDQTYASQLMGVEKPDPAFWKMIMLSEGFEAKHTFFTDDRKENTDAAAGLGITVHLFTDCESLCKCIEHLYNK